MNAEETHAAIREVLADQAGLSQPLADLQDDDDLYAAGMTSFASVNVMLALEEKFDIEFPDSMLNRNAFASVDAIAAALDQLLASA